MKVAYINVEHKQEFLKQINADVLTSGLPLHLMFGVDVRFTDYTPKWHTKWKFPDDPFWQYEASDEQWCRQLGIGGEVEDRSKIAVFFVDESFLYQPVMKMSAMTA